ncbi:MAG: BadF/BadG/BcrA/BcrD ATPase family protein [Deinococcales bacterium]
MKDAVLGLDGGASSSRWLLLDSQGQEVFTGRLGAITGHLFDEAAREDVLGPLETLVTGVRTVLEQHHLKLTSIVAGITGLSEGDESAQFLENYLRNSLNPEKIGLYHDMVIAYRNAFKPGEGILIYAGTGAIAFYMDEEKSLRAGGYGYLIDDEGAGFGIGRAALQWLMRAHDETGERVGGVLAGLLYGGGLSHCPNPRSCLWWWPQ